MRTVNISSDRGTLVSNNPIGDEKTLFPLQAAIGYDITQTLFIGKLNLVVEGVSDYWYLSIISDYLAEQSKTSLAKELVITPCGGAQKIPYMVTFLSSHLLQVLILIDDESQSRNMATDIVKTKVIKDEYIVYTTDAFKDNKPKEADIEDILTESTYSKLIEEAYSKELVGKTLQLNTNIPRIVKRYELAFKDTGLDFHKMRVAKLFLNKMAESKTAILTDEDIKRFEQLFAAINQKVRLLQTRETARKTIEVVVS